MPRQAEEGRIDELEDPGAEGYILLHDRRHLLHGSVGIGQGLEELLVDPRLAGEVLQPAQGFAEAAVLEERLHVAGTLHHLLEGLRVAWLGEELMGHRDRAEDSLAIGMTGEADPGCA